MKIKDPFISLAELVITDQPIGRLATAIEVVGFYTWDRFRRFTLVTQESTSEEHNNLFKWVLDALAKGVKEDEIDFDYYNEMSFGPTILNLCGWTKSTIPDFEKLNKEWVQCNVDSTNEPSYPVYKLTFAPPKKKDDWYYCIKDAVYTFKLKHGTYATEPQLWAFLYSCNLNRWEITIEKNSMKLGSVKLDRANFKKRFGRYCSFTATNN